MRRDALFAGLGLASIPIITGPLSEGLRVGTFVCLYQRAMSGTANTDTTLSHPLGRTPSLYLVVRTQKGGVTYDGSNLGSDWSATSLVLRSTVASDVVTLLVA